MFQRAFTRVLFSRVSNSIDTQTYLLRIDYLKRKPFIHKGYTSLRFACFQNTQTYMSTVNQEQFLNGTSASYIEQMYDSWLLDPKSVNASWDAFFQNCSSGMIPGLAYQAPPTLSVPSKNELIFLWNTPKSDKFKGTENDKIINDHFAVQSVIRSYQLRGHNVAKLDPLQLNEVYLNKDYSSQTIYRSFSPFADSDMNRIFKLPPTTLIGNNEGSLSLKEILSRLENAYCRSIGAEYMFINSFDQCNWIRERIEVPGKMALDKNEKLRILTRLTKTIGFESFLSRKWPNEKRYGIEGCEMLIPALNEIVDKSSVYGVDSIIIGMPHRGRLNVFANVCNQPLNIIFAQFQCLEVNGDGSGDVKHHLGTFTEQTNDISKKKLSISVVANPSHLEAVNSVVQGKTRAEQFFRGDSNGKNIMSILLHGDSSLCGQGIVYETFQLSELPDYTTHGTIHIVVNNQIGFTTDPKVSRSSPYCTDIAKILNAPIFHVNADDPEAVINICKIAAEWRTTFKKDVVIDLVSYRRNGHDELDEPMFTQPNIYKIIKNTNSVYEKYSTILINENTVSAEEVKREQVDYERICEEEFTVAEKETQINYKDWLDSPWTGFFKDINFVNVPKSGVNEDTLKHIGKVFSSLPTDAKTFVVHKGIERIFKSRQQMIKDRTVDWALAEAMTFGSLLKNGIHVRLSGQDVERGTFSHRHHVLHNQNDVDDPNDSTYRPLCNLYPDQAQYTVCNSLLSEFAVVGFELGFSMANPNSLVCWEAQFGDFNNTAQCIIDQFISSGQDKWSKQSGLVLLLPHAYEGMGPEHSSARLERFLQMSSDDPDVVPEYCNYFAICQLYKTNWIVVNCSTPANYFHILRRQVLLPFRKPLIIMTPKSLLRHPDAKSSFDEMTDDTEFLRIIPENGNATKNVHDVKRLIFCTGKVYYDLVEEREKRKLSDNVAICRVEQISPFPFDLVKKECDKYDNANIIWTQEEPKNQGAWPYVQPRFKTVLKNAKSIGYAGRPVAASPATGNKVKHVTEIKNLLDVSFAI